MSEASLIYVTTGSEEEARKIATDLVEARLVACANILAGMRSVYWWKGKIVRDEETVLILKTRSQLVPQVTDRVKALHSNECPCVVALPIAAGNAAFLRWIEQETAAGASQT